MCFRSQDGWQPTAQGKGVASVQASRTHSQNRWKMTIFYPGLTGSGWNHLETKFVLPDLALWATRLATMVFTIGYILPIFDNPYNSYYKVKMLHKQVKVYFLNLLNLKNSLKQRHGQNQLFWSLGIDGKCCHLSSPSTPETAPGFV